MYEIILHNYIRALRNSVHFEMPLFGSSKEATAESVDTSEGEGGVTAL